MGGVAISGRYRVCPALSPGTCGQIQTLQPFRKGLDSETHASPSMRTRVYEVAPEVALCLAHLVLQPSYVRKLARIPSEFPAIVWALLALSLWDGLCVLLSPGREPTQELLSSFWSRSVLS